MFVFVFRQTNESEIFGVFHSKGHIWTVRVIFSCKKSTYGPYGPYISGRKSIYGPSVSPFLKKKSYILWTVSQSISGKQSVYMDRQSVHFWTKVHIRTSKSILKSSLLSRTFAKESIFGTCSWKNEHGNFGIKVNTSNFLKMAPQAKPLYSRDLYANSV